MRYNELTIREAQREDQLKVFELTRKIYEETGGMAFGSLDYQVWKRKHLHNPFGKTLFFIVLHQAQPVAIYGNMFIPLKIGNRRFLGSLAIDALTEAPYRQGGLFSTLVEGSYEVLKKEGVALALGFPNESSYPGFVKKLGWSLIEDISVWVKPLNLERCVAFLFKSRLLSKALSPFLARILEKVRKPSQVVASQGWTQVEETKEFDPSVDDLYRRASSSMENMIERRSTYLNWRYGGREDGPYMMFMVREGPLTRGYMVVRCLEAMPLKAGAIVDFLWEEGTEQALSLLRQGLNHFEERGMEVAFMLAPKRPSDRRLFRDCGFIPLPAPLRPRRFRLIGKLIDPTRVMPEALLNRGQWHITLGDWDVI